MSSSSSRASCSSSSPCLKVREKIVEAIPLGVRYGIAPAIGLMLMNIGLGSNVGIYAEGNGFTSPFYIMRDFFGALTRGWRSCWGGWRPCPPD